MFAELGSPVISARKRSLFNRMDTNKDGKIDVEEFTNFCSSSKSIKLTPDDILHLFERVDIDKSGAIDFEEFTMLVPEDKKLWHYDPHTRLVSPKKPVNKRIAEGIMSPMQRFEVLDLFEKIDKDRSKSIEYHELENFCNENNICISREDLIMLFEEADKDGSGGISIDEFSIIFHRANFAKFLKKEKLRRANCTSQVAWDNQNTSLDKHDMENTDNKANVSSKNKKRSTSSCKNLDNPCLKSFMICATWLSVLSIFIESQYLHEMASDSTIFHVFFSMEFVYNSFLVFEYIGIHTNAKKSKSSLRDVTRDIRDVLSNCKGKCSFRCVNSFLNVMCVVLFIIWASLKWTSSMTDGLEMALLGLRLLRVIKIFAYYQYLQIVISAFGRTLPQLGIIYCCFIIFGVVCAQAIFMFEMIFEFSPYIPEYDQGYTNPIQDMGSAMMLTVDTLSQVGARPDLVPRSPVSKMVVAAMAIAALLLMGMLYHSFSSNYLEEIRISNRLKLLAKEHEMNFQSERVKMLQIGNDDLETYHFDKLVKEYLENSYETINYDEDEEFYTSIMRDAQKLIHAKLQTMIKKFQALREIHAESVSEEISLLLDDLFRKSKVSKKSSSLSDDVENKAAEETNPTFKEGSHEL